MVEPLRHRQTKGAETDMLSLTPPRHVSTLPTPAVRSSAANFRFRSDSGCLITDGRGTPRKYRHLLDEPAGVCYCFSELWASRLTVSWGRDGVGDLRETKMGSSH